MHCVSFIRNGRVFKNVYGRVLFDGKKVTYDGLTCIFQKHLERGIIGLHNKRFKPEDGIDFLKNLKYQFSESDLKATDIMELQKR